MKNRIWVMIIIAGAACMWNLSSCSKGGDGPSSNPPPPPPPPPVNSCSGTPGPLFTAVKNLVNSRCLSCHNTGLANGGVSYSDPCNIVAKRDRIRIRAVVEGSMPETGPLSQSEKDIISAWINGGGKYTD